MKTIRVHRAIGAPQNTQITISKSFDKIVDPMIFISHCEREAAQIFEIFIYCLPAHTLTALAVLILNYVKERGKVSK